MSVWRGQPVRRRAFLVAALTALAIVGFYEPVAVLLAAPWLLAVAWVVVRSGLDVVAGDDGVFPSLGEEARRRLTIH